VEVLSDVLRESWLKLNDSSSRNWHQGLGHRVTERPLRIIENIITSILFRKQTSLLVTDS